MNFTSFFEHTVILRTALLKAMSALIRVKEKI